MAGLLDSTQPQSAPQNIPNNMSDEGMQEQSSIGAGGQDQTEEGEQNQLQDPILQQIEDGIEAKVPPNLKQAYMAVLVSGMKIMFSAETSKFMDQRLQQASDPVQAVSKGISDMMVMIYLESKKTMNIPAGMLASMSLTCQALDYAERAGKIKVTEELAGQAVQSSVMATMARFGITQDKINQTVSQAQAKIKSGKGRIAMPGVSQQGRAQPAPAQQSGMQPESLPGI